MTQHPHPHPQRHRHNAPAARRTMFYLVPTSSPSTTTDKVGAFLRLGEYSDVEQRVYDHGHEDDLFPAQHISDEGDDSSVYTNAAGGSEGIMMSCDGRILVKAAERMYLETGQYHQKTNGNHTLDINGTQTTSIENHYNLDTEKGDVNVTSASKLKVTCQKEERKIKDKSDHTYDKWHLIKYKDSYESHKYGWDFQSIYGFNMTSYYGGIMESVYGVRMQFDKFNFFSDWVCLNWKGTQIDIKAIVMKKVTAKFGATDCSAEWEEIKVGLQGMKAEATRLEAKRKELQVKSVQAELKNFGCDVKLGNLSCFV
jgi:hypothetical protein